MSIYRASIPRQVPPQKWYAKEKVVLLLGFGLFTVVSAELVLVLRNL